MYRRFLLTMIIVLSLVGYFAFVALAQTSQVIVNGSTLVLEGSAGMLYGVDINANSLTITMKGGTNLTITALDGRMLQVASGHAQNAVCNDSISSVTLAPPASVGVVDIVVNVGSTFCGAAITATPVSSSLPEVSVAPQVSQEQNKNFISKIFSSIDSLRSSVTVQTAVKIVTKPISVVAAITGIISIIITTSAASATVASALAQFLNFFSNFRFSLLGFVRIKKRQPWGRVVYRDSNEPAEGVTVQIYDFDFKKLKDTQKTDKEGRFGALVASGSYYIKISKPGFVTTESAKIQIGDINQVLNIQMIIAPLEAIESSEISRLLGFKALLSHILESINPYILLVGSILSIINALAAPSSFNYAILILYIILDILKIYLHYHLIRPFGRVVDWDTKKSLGLSIVRIFDFNRKMLLATRVTDEEGRFSFLLIPGSYYITCTHTGFSAFSSDPMTLKFSGILNTDIALKKL